MTVSLSTRTAATNRPATVASVAASNQAHPGRHGMPPIIPASELYFWSTRWQAQEQAFEDARAAGELIESSSMDEVIHDLMRVDPADEDEG